MARQSERGSRRRQKKTVLRVDMTGVDAEGRSIDDGWAHGVVKKATIRDSKSSDSEMIAMQWKATRGKESAIVFDNVVATESSLWKMAMMCKALGLDVPDGMMEIDCEELPGLECDILIANEDYNGRDQPRLVEFRPTKEEDKDAKDDDDDKDDDKPRRRSASKRDKDDDDDDRDDRDDRDDDKDDKDDNDDDKPRRKVTRRAKDDDDDQDDDRPRRRSKDDDDDKDDNDDDDRSSKRRSSKRDDDDDDDDRGGKDDDQEDDRDDDRKPRKTTKQKFRDGSKVVFNDEKDRETRGVVKSYDGKSYVVKTSKGEEYEIEERDLDAA